MSEENKPEVEEKVNQDANAVAESDQPEMQEVKADSKVRQVAHSDVGEAKSRPNKKRSSRGAAPKKADDDPFVEKVLAISRVAKATKGGTKLSFSALVVVGDTKGKVGFYLGKGNEVATAIRKAMTGAKKKMITVPMNGSTIPHQVVGEWCGAQVLLKPAGEGTGVIASSAVRAVCDGAGIHNILTKCHRSNNSINVVRATFEGLKSLKTAEHYKNLRNK